VLLWAAATASAWPGRHPAAAVGGPAWTRSPRCCWTGCRTGAAAAWSASCKTEIGDSLDLLLGPLATLGFCQPDGTFITSLDDLGRWLAEMAAAGEAVCMDGLATRVQRPRGWADQKVLYDAKRHTHTARDLAVSTVHGDLLWCDDGWPRSYHEHELIQLPGLGGMLDEVEVASLLDRGFRGLAKGREHWHVPVGDRRTLVRLFIEHARRAPAGDAVSGGHFPCVAVSVSGRSGRWARGGHLLRAA
jgi:hypothetical protein